MIEIKEGGKYYGKLLMAKWNYDTLETDEVFELREGDIILRQDFYSPNDKLQILRKVRDDK